MEKLLYAKQDLEKYGDSDINLLARSLGITEEDRNDKVWLITLKLHTGRRSRSQKAQMPSILEIVRDYGFDNTDLSWCILNMESVEKLDFLPDHVKETLRNEKLYDPSPPPQLIFSAQDGKLVMRIESYLYEDAHIEHEEIIDEDTLFSWAVRLSGEKCDYDTSFGGTVLLLAAKDGELDKVEILLAAGINPDARDIAEATPLMLAARRKHVPVFNALLAKGADPHLQDGYQYTALMYASEGELEEKGNLEMVQALLAKGVDPNVKNWNDQTALWLAASDGELPIVQALLDKGADPAVVATDGNTALMMAQDPEIKKMIMASFPYKTKGQVMNAMAQKKITRKDGMELMKILPVTLATKEEIKAAAECSPPAEYKVCANDKDLVTNECWSAETPPELVLSFLDLKDPSRKPYTLCLRLEQFRKWVSDPENEYRGWYPNVDNQSVGKTLADIHPQGYGGSPSQVESFIKLPGEIHVYVSNTRAELTQLPAGEYTGYPVYTHKRIGNVQGRFGQGDIHGQVPGETIYYLVPKTGDEQQIRNLLKHEFLRMWIMKSAKSTATPEKTVEEILARFGEIKDLVPKVDKVTPLGILQKWLRDLGKVYTIPELVNLKELDLSSEGLTKIPAEIGELTNLKHLHLYSNELSTIPPEIGKLVNLKGLHLGTNELTMIPAEIGKLSNLQSLYLYENQLKAIPVEIGKLSNLQNLYPYGNQLTTLPAEIGNLSNLLELQLQSNQLTALPVELGNLSSLQELLLEENQLTTIPAEIGKLTKLQVLDLDNNKLTAIPVEIGELSNLQELSLEDNQLTTIPAAVGDLELQSLNLSNNPLDVDMPKAKGYKKADKAELQQALAIIKSKGAA